MRRSTCKRSLLAAIAAIATTSTVAVLLSAPATAQPPAAPAADTAFSAAGLYNLANSYARAGKPGLAVLNYERAALLAPNDADIKANLNHVRASLHLPAATPRKLEKIARLTSPAVVASTGVLGVLLVGLGLFCVRLRPEWRWSALTSLALGAVSMGFTACNAIFWEPMTHEAIVIVATSPILATPVPMGDQLQQLAEAQSVTIIERHEDFVLVSTSAGRNGWVARADLADVVPKTAR